MNRPILAAFLSGTGLVAALGAASPALAGPVVCTTTLEAPIAAAAPVELTRCGPIQTVPGLVTRRFYSYSAPFERGIDITHQVTDILGIAMGGGDGTRVMGFGFPDQTIVYDGLALQNTTAAQLEAQSSVLPIRTADLNSCFTTSMSDFACSGRRLAPKISAYGLSATDPYGRGSYGNAFMETGSTVRGLW